MEWNECTPTFTKILYFILDGMKLQPNIDLKGKNLSDIKYKIYAQLEQELLKKLNAKDSVKVILGGKFVPATIFTYHESKKDCINFLKELQKESSDKQ
jgi:hypothetical protein